MNKIKLNKNIQLIIAILNVVIALIIFKIIPDKFLIKYEFFECPGNNICRIPILRVLNDIGYIFSFLIYFGGLNMLLHYLTGKIIDKYNDQLKDTKNKKIRILVMKVLEFFLKVMMSFYN